MTIYNFISDLHDTRPNTRLSAVKQELSVSKSEFSSSFEKLKDSITVKFSDINAGLDEIEKNKKISYRGSYWEHNEHQEHDHWCPQSGKSKPPKLQKKVKKLEDQLLELDQKSNNLDQ